MPLYYQDDYVTLYHGDCLTEHREWLDADVLVTDPPYGMSYAGFTGRSNMGKKDNTKHGAIDWDCDTTVRDGILASWGSRPALVFGTWRVQRPSNTRQLIIWDKSRNGPGMGALDLPWGPSHEDIYVLGSGFIGKRESSVLTVAPYNSQASDRPNHPTPKPVGLMEQLIMKCPPGIIADPAAGGGSTLMAARNLGRKSIGVELEEKYCEVIAKRFDQGALELEWTA